MRASSELTRRRRRMKPAAVSDPAQTLEGLLAKHAIVLVGGSARVVAWKPRGLYPGDTGNVIDLMHEAAFRLYYRHLYVLAPVASGGTTRVSLAARFFDVAERYPGLVYAPGEGEVVSGQFNMWRGFGVTPAAGDWILMQAHIKNVLAAGDDEVHACGGKAVQQIDHEVVPVVDRRPERRLDSGTA